ncbi:ferric reductase like transmembrane component-domain-containing protein [Lophiotrema nucula]|uniref:ferric-chelate reductase (NADPH) n=1 Tax=Lophiotrema nucula TaxID=690887 RepID=A0A6A5Z817_9PLEO|nr:ferric reductase like transmembrane component-domain-containing protein [Lophiotrema nucula]
MVFAQDSAHGAGASAAKSAGGAVSTAAAGGGGGGHAEGPTSADFENVDVQHFFGYIWVAFLFCFITYQAIFHFVRYVRTVACLNNETQRYFATPHALYAWFKRNCLDAPLFKTRHHREFKLSTAINIGTLPSRLQMFLLVGYFATNVGFCVWSIDFSQSYSSVAGEVRNRSGVLAVMNMIPLFLLAGRNNPFITLTGISFDTMNLIHRWFGRIVVLEALTHTLAYFTNKVHTKGWPALGESITGSAFIMWGFIGTVCFFFILIQSPSPVRHAFYETFLHLHICAAALALAAVWIHLNGRPQQQLLYGVVALWAIERTVRLVRLFMRNVGNGGTKADVEVLPGDALRVTVRMARPWRFRPGQHAYLYMPSVGLWTNHPFSLAWSDEEEDLNISSMVTDEKGLPMNRQDILEKHKTSMSFIVRRRTGFTEKLYKKADLSAAGKFTTTAFVEGPYGGEDLSSYGTVMLWAAGIGITHQVPHVRDIVTAYANGTTATRRVTLVWIIQSPEHLEWIRTWMTQILSMPRRREILKILLFVTRPRSTKEIHSPSSSVQMFPGKPNVQALVDQEMQEGIGAACVSVCGTGGLADDLRRAVRNRERQWNVDFREESFSW